MVIGEDARLGPGEGLLQQDGLGLPFRHFGPEAVGEVVGADRGRCDLWMRAREQEVPCQPREHGGLSRALACLHGDAGLCGEDVEDFFLPSVRLDAEQFTHHRTRLLAPSSDLVRYW